MRSERLNALSDFAIIPARGSSKGVPRKNVRPLAGLPLVAHSIVSANDSGLFDEIHVSTDDDEVAHVAETFGAVVIERPANLAADTSAMFGVVEHALSWYEGRGGTPTRIFLLQPTSPLRSAGDIREAARLLSEDCDAVMGVFETPQTPYWSLRGGTAGYLEPVFSLEHYLSRRQDLEALFFDGPLYAIETGSFRRYERFLTPRTRFFVIPPSRAIDIDTEFDFRLAEFLITQAGAMSDSDG